LASTGVDLGLAVRAQGDQLGPVPDGLAEFPDRWWGDPRFGQPAHPQQVGKVRGVPQIVLHPAVLEGLHPERVGQVQTRLARQSLQDVDRPVPAVGTFQDDLRVLSGPGHDLCQCQRRVGDLDRFQHFAGVRGPHDHAAPAMQVDPHKLTPVVPFHPRGLLRRET
jgi:hypothetical protein